MNLNEQAKPAAAPEISERVGARPLGPPRGAVGHGREPSSVAPARSPLVPLALAAGLYFCRVTRGTAEDHADYRFESYQEDAGRIGVETQSWLFEKKLTSWLSLRGQAVYDAISGATPSGAPPPSQIAFATPQTVPLSSSVPTLFMRDKRWAGSLDGIITAGSQRITPQFAYSSEHDYLSYGASLNYAVDFNQKNTTLNLGWSHDWDRILPNSATFIGAPEHKDTDSFLIGVNQLLSARTVLTVNFSYANAHGYLADPYRGVVFDDYPQTDADNLSLFGEKRPRHRQSFIGYASILQYITPLHGGVEGSYRFFHDTFGIDAHTLAIAWHQKLGARVTVSPLFRYYVQSAAGFYATHFAGDPSDPTNPTPVPAYYSADYRLSELNAFTYGVEASVRALEWLSFDAAFKRYEMSGLDHVTSASAYPKANIATLGARVWF